MLQVGRVESDVKTLFGLYRPCHADAALILGAHDKGIVRLAVVLPSSTPMTSVAFPADFVLVDQDGYTYSASLLNSGQTKVFMIRPVGVIGAIVHGIEDVKIYFLIFFWMSSGLFFYMTCITLNL
ncbi:uncharacterized protein BJ212DRAFT_1352286 [Suillus subaureus]|uniref:Uncharacterized protein n=1 Tax=Suillus subaureus TaxID=48587 RepID=A0A9P7ED47_9AGAM|nr:uncharacterized protein BJ212DRAFT_1352286 [Suillus subaureus]KAG1817296.1 hypothetical protein BJ212DRAFT_1352286 [Suillus subaureus]